MTTNVLILYILAIIVQGVLQRASAVTIDNYNHNAYQGLRRDITKVGIKTITVEGEFEPRHEDYAQVWSESLAEWVMMDITGSTVWKNGQGRVEDAITGEGNHTYFISWHVPANVSGQYQYHVKMYPLYTPIVLPIQGEFTGYVYDFSDAYTATLSFWSVTKIEGSTAWEGGEGQVNTTISGDGNHTYSISWFVPKSVTAKYSYEVHLSPSIDTTGLETLELH